MPAPTNDSSGLFASATGWVFLAFVVIALFFLAAEHWAHLGAVMPYVTLALLGLCVVLHAYMHGRLHPPHDHGGRSNGTATRHHPPHGSGTDD